MTHRVSSPAIQGHIAVTDGQPTTTTQDIAEVYGKQHAKVLSIVRQRMAEAGEWGVANFGETSYTNPQNGQTYPVIRMTKKGFHFVVGKFTGAKAVAHQIAFADEFERMERQLLKAPSYAVAPQQTLSDQEASMLRGLISGHAEAPPKERRAEFIIKAWSKLKAHFKTDYRHIPAHCFTEALSIVSRYIAENAAAPQMPAHTDSRQLDEASRSLIQAALHLQQASNAIKRADGGVGIALWLSPPLESLSIN
jgi:Rha family phage regulatory protein